MDNPKIDKYGTKYWYLNGQLHREDGPAVKRLNGDKFWYLNGKCHREDGPAVEYTDGIKFWFYYGQQIRVDSNEEFLRLVKLKSFW